MGSEMRIFTIAKDLNISSDTLKEFLEKQGIKIRGPMTKVSEDAYSQVMEHFKTEKLLADKYHLRREMKAKEIQESEGISDDGQDVTAAHVVDTILDTPPVSEKIVEVEKEAEEIFPPDEILDEAIELKVEPEKKPADSTDGQEKTKKKTRFIKKLIKPELLKKLSSNKFQRKPIGASHKNVASSTAITAKRRHRKKRKKISQEEIQASIKETMIKIKAEEIGKKRKRRKGKNDFEDDLVEQNIIRVSEYISVGELADLMDVSATDIIQKCMELGLIVTINQRLDIDIISLIAGEFDYEVEELSEYGVDMLEEMQPEDEDESLMEPRPPIVTIMGHVDHGKTSLLDYTRESNIVANEAGAITQHIGAYEVLLSGDRRITFLDTPGHEAFTAMRARGVQATDIVVLVIAADDAVRPQTVEAIHHAQAANVPIIIAINKIDKPNSNPEKIKKELTKHNVVVEEWGGKYHSVEISAKTGKGIDQLLETVLLVSEILDLKVNPNKRASGIVLESRLDKGKGPVSTLLIQSGTLRVGDPCIAGLYGGRVRAILNERNVSIEYALPSTPVQVLGFSGTAKAGDSFIVLDSERDVKNLSLKRQKLRREQDFHRIKLLTLDEISRQIKEGKVKELNIIVKGDVNGSVEAVSDSLMEISNSEVAVNIIHSGAGPISESDVLLASASGAVIIGFNIHPTPEARIVARQDNVDIRIYEVIYDVVEDVRIALEGMLEPDIVENITGMAEVIEIFKVPKIGNIAGSKVREGKIRRKDKVRLIREGLLQFEGNLVSLRRFKEDVREVATGFECGIGFENYNDIKVGDVIECFELVEHKRKLDIKKS